MRATDLIAVSAQLGVEAPKVDHHCIHQLAEEAVLCACTRSDLGSKGFPESNVPFGALK